ncbi:MAG: hypothetical protein SFY66_19660 [Oculatellaceae cyanobacterium bins.114]|nr:hypothetical protein [Oculatellaceae cyanobacterium bins.114]
MQSRQIKAQNYNATIASLKGNDAWCNDCQMLKVLCPCNSTNPTNADVDALLNRAAELNGTPVYDDGDDSLIPDDWDDLWQRYNQFVGDRPYLSDRSPA